MTFADAKQRFSNRVADYVRYRPSYPPDLLDLLPRNAVLRPNHVIADIGSGTGLLSKLFLDNGNHVYGVEPNAEMRAAGEEFLRGYPNFPASTAPPKTPRSPMPASISSPPAKRFTGSTSRLPRSEFLRILKPGGWVIVIWQDRRMEETPFASRIRSSLASFRHRLRTSQRRLSGSGQDAATSSTPVHFNRVICPTIRISISKVCAAVCAAVRTRRPKPMPILRR